MILRLNTDIAAGVFGLLFAALLWFPSGNVGRFSILFPRAILVITVVVCIALVIKGFFKPGERHVEITGSPRRLVIVMVGLFAWWYAIGELGFVVTTAIAFLALTWYLASVEEHVTGLRIVKWLPVIAALIAVFYLTFTHLLNVRLPTGVFL